jgi:hypothetical protein
LSDFLDDLHVVLGQDVDGHVEVTTIGNQVP